MFGDFERVSKSMAISINTSFLPLIFLVLQRLNFAALKCHPKYEWSSGSFDQTGIKHRAMLGHSFKNFTVKTSFDCHVKCFDEKCRCQAYQMWGNHCELLDEDAYSAPDDLVNVVGYFYFDMNREYVVKVRTTWVGHGCQLPEFLRTEETCSQNSLQG